MGSTNISGLVGMFVQEQTKNVGQTEPKTNDVANRFQEYMQQMSTRITGGLVSGQGQTMDMAEKRLSVRESGKEDPQKTALDYETCRDRCTKIQSVEDTGKEPDPMEMSQAVDDYAKEVLEAVKEEFGVTDEQLAQAMETLGLTMLDLMNPNQLAALVAELTGAEEAGDMLFDAGFLQLMQEVDTLSREFLQELGISKEELISLCEAAALTEEQTVPEDTMEFVPTEESNPQEPAFVEQPITGAETADRNIPETEILVVDEGQQDAQVSVVEPVQETIQSKEQMAAVPEKEVHMTADTEEEAAPVQPVQEQEISDAKQTEDSVPVVVREETTEELPQKESDSDGGQTLSHNQDTTNGQGDHAAQLVQHVEHVEVPVTETVSEQAGYSEQVDVANIIREIVEFTRVHVTEQATTLQMQLNPEHLGKVMLELTAKEGAVTARIFAQNEIVREALEAQMVDLRQNMNQAGIKVEAIEVTVESHEFERNLEQQANQEKQQAQEQEEASRHHRRINLMDAEGLDALTGMMSEEEALVAQIMADRGNSIDFTA